jgi:3-deoxy-D-manno-octulosonate 8-phosphate phosphatase (KDO 8-P phosphatase)
VTLAGNRKCPSHLELVGFDVDGVFTDGRFYISDEGVETKAFFTQDGFGVRQLLNAGIEVVIISGRKSKAVDIRMGELGVTHVVQGCRDKVAAFDKLAEKLGVSNDRTAFVGDDIPDLLLLRHVGFSFAVANAVPAVQAECDVITSASGGFGAVREVCELILSSSEKG